MKWMDLLVENVIWENGEILQHPELKLLEDKQFQGGQTVMSPIF